MYITYLNWRLYYVRERPRRLAQIHPSRPLKLSFHLFPFQNIALTRCVRNISTNPLNIHSAIQPNLVCVQPKSKSTKYSQIRVIFACQPCLFAVYRQLSSWLQKPVNISVVIRSIHMCPLVYPLKYRYNIHS